MSLLRRLRRQAGQNRISRWLLAAGLGALVGISAGHSLKGSVAVVDGNSMAPTFEPGARIYTAQVSGPLERGDVVLVDDGRQEYALKRVIGLPGETVHLWRGYVFVNRRLLKEPYLPKYTFTFPDPKTGEYTFQLGEGEYFVLGDNRLYSVDSRRYGPVSRDHIRGRVPQPENMVRAQVAPFTLPDLGKRTIRAL